MHLPFYFLPSISLLLLFGLLCSAKPLDRREIMDTTDTEHGKPLGLYAYGDGIYGLPIFYETGETYPVLIFCSFIQFFFHRRGQSSDWVTKPVIKPDPQGDVHGEQDVDARRW